MNGVSLGGLIRPDAVLFDLQVGDKAAMLAAMAARAAALAECDAAAATAVIMDREALGSTGFGAGTAIPHGRLTGLVTVVVVAARLAAPVAYAALDGMPVDLAVLMLAPADAGAAHLKALAQVSRAFRDPVLCGKLRGATSAAALYTVFAGEQQQAA